MLYIHNVYVFMSDIRTPAPALCKDFLDEDEVGCDFHDMCLYNLSSKYWHELRMFNNPMASEKVKSFAFLATENNIRYWGYAVYQARQISF